MRYQGRITRWIDDKGYGYLTWNGGGELLFIHVKAFSPGSRRPVVGDIVIYEQGQDERGRGCAIRASFPRKPGVMSKGTAHASFHTGRFWAAAASVFVALLCAATAFGRLPSLVLAVYAGASFVTFLAYGFDKNAAQQRRWRTQESTLLFLGFIGGWPGGVAGQKVFRHKLRKSSFMWFFLGTVLANIAVLLLVVVPSSKVILGVMAGAD
jgi:uncharacterized membrane protein YsdA (DUF1294 family)/cold shock CspA family protein